MIKKFDEFINDVIEEGYLRRIISSEINKEERIEDSVKKEEILKRIESWLDEMGVKNYTIDEKTLEIDVDGDVDLSGNIINGNNKTPKIEGDKLPDYIKFREVTGNFVCSCNNLKSLEGCPKKVGGDFSCSYNNLTSLEGCPDEVKSSFYCLKHSVELKSIEGCPKKIGNSFYCSIDNLKSFRTGQKEKVIVYSKFFSYYKKKDDEDNINKDIIKNEILKYFDVEKENIRFISY